MSHDYLYKHPNIIILHSQTNSFEVKPQFFSYILTTNMPTIPLFLKLHRLYQ